MSEDAAEESALAKRYSKDTLAAFRAGDGAKKREIYFSLIESAVIRDGRLFIHYKNGQEYRVQLAQYRNTKFRIDSYWQGGLELFKKGEFLKPKEPLYQMSLLYDYKTHDRTYLLSDYLKLQNPEFADEESFSGSIEDTENMLTGYLPGRSLIERGPIENGTKSKAKHKTLKISSSSF